MVTVTDFGSAASLHWGLWAFAQLISIWLLSGLWQGHCSTSILLFSVILVSICCCAHDHCPVVWPKFGLSFSCRTDDLTCDVLCYIEEFMVNSVIVRWPAPPPSSFGHPISLGAADWSSQGVFSLSCKNYPVKTFHSANTCSANTCTLTIHQAQQTGMLLSGMLCL